MQPAGQISVGFGILLRQVRLALLTIFTLLGSSLTISNSHASSAQVFFGANLAEDNRCTIIVTQGGTLVADLDGDQLSSLLTSGSPGIAEVTAGRQYDISVDAPAFFLSGPQGANDSVTYTAYFSGAALNKRGLDFPMREGSNAVTTTRQRSRTQITVNLVADRPDYFPAGDYSAEATVRCE